MSSVDPAIGFAPAAGDERLTAAIVSDSLDAAGLRNQVLERRLAPLLPGSRAMGRAATIRFEPVDRRERAALDSADPYRSSIDFIDSLQAGQLVVIATGESNASAVWGELFSAAALGSGVRGVVTDGNLRDTEHVATLGFPAFSLSRRPIDYRARMCVAEAGRPVTLCGVLVSPGDLVVADDDGVVVVPRAHEAEVLTLARTRAAGESTVLSELLAGETLSAVWQRHGLL